MWSIFIYELIFAYSENMYTLFQNEINMRLHFVERERERTIVYVFDCSTNKSRIKKFKVKKEVYTFSNCNNTSLIIY